METEDNNSKRFNSMLSMWYGVIIGALQGYLIVQNVWKFVRYAELPWPYQKTPTVELNVYIGMTGLAVLLLPFFLSACFLKIGNLANDNQMLGKRLRFRDDWTKLLAANKLQDVKSLFVTLWKHCGPVSSLLHLICAVSLLFPQILMESVLVKSGFLSNQYIWKTDLDIMLRNNADITYIKSLPSEHGIETRVFPIPTPQKADGLSLEFINYAIALFIYSMRYAQVFWECHKPFAIVFGLQQIFSTIHTLISLCTFAILYKVHITNAYGDSQSTIPFLLDGYITLLLHAITSTILFLSSNVLYHLGFIKFTSFVQEKIRKLHVTKKNDSSAYSFGWSYFPHSAAVSIALALAATQSPLVHDAYLLYQLSSNKLMILYAVSTVAHFLCWIVLWLVLTFTGTWNFLINAVMFQPIDGLEPVGLSAEITIDRKSDAPINPFASSLLVICEGKAFSVENVEDQRSVMSIIPKTRQAAEPIYWKKPPQDSNPLPSCMATKTDGWSKEHKGIKYMAVRKEVTFDDELQSPRYYSPSQREKSGWKSPTPNRCCEGNVESSRDFDSGEYAYLSGGRGSIMKKFLSDNHESTKGCRSVQESIYGTNPLVEERKLVSSPVPTIDSSSGVSSAGSQRSNMGPPSSTPSCSQYSEGSYSEKRNSNIMIVEPSAHYEPAPVRGISRRSSMRVTPCSPIYETKTQISKEYPMISKCATQIHYDSGIYGKLRWDNAAPRSSPNYEAIYGQTRRSNYGELRSPLINEHNEDNVECKEIVVENLRRPVDESNNMSDSMTDICPPIPPPLPVLSYVTRQNSTVSSNSPYSNHNSNNGILITTAQMDSSNCNDYSEC